jgi:hypothetical protein
LIGAAVEPQMRRPALARMIDFEERRLPVDEQNQRVAGILQQAIVDALQLDDAPRVADRELAAQDVLALAHGIIDAAGERGETDARGLLRRVRIAVAGYLVGIAVDS